MLPCCGSTDMSKQAGVMCLYQVGQRVRPGCRLLTHPPLQQVMPSAWILSGSPLGLESTRQHGPRPHGNMLCLMF